MDEDEMLDSD